MVGDVAHDDSADVFRNGSCDRETRNYIGRFVERCNKYDWEEEIPWEGQDRLDDLS